MDLTKDRDECKFIETTYHDYAKYKKYYSVLDSWADIETHILDTYKKPKKYLYDTEMPKFISPANFYKQSKKAVENTLYYFYHKLGSVYYARIRNNKLIQFNYIWNNDYKNYVSDHLLIDPKYEWKYKNQDKSRWKINNAMIRVYEKKYEGYGMDFYYSEIKYLLQEVCKSFKMADCDFVIWGKDCNVIKKDLTEPWEEIVGSTNYRMPSKFVFDEYCPIFSFNWNDRYADLPLPTPDDVRRIFELYAPPKCENIYLDIPEIKWSDKIPTAIFRGSFTGSSAKIKINPRLHIAFLSNSWKSDPKYKIAGIPILDAGISSKGGYTRGRKDIDDKYIRFVDANYWPYLLKDPISHKQQAYYKYIIYIEGNVSAYRGAFLFSLGSVVLWVKSKKYYLWFEERLQDMINCVMINYDLSNLEEKIRWLIANDTQAQKIANAGKTLYNTYLTAKPILTYTAKIINAASGI